MTRRGSLGPHFRAFWVATGVSNVGDGIRLTALPLLAASLTRDAQLVAGVTAANWIPWVLFGLPGGAMVDRMDRRVLIRNVQVIRASLIAAFAAAVWQGWGSIPLVYAIGFCIGTGEVLADSAIQTIVPALVSDERLEDGYGRIGAADLGGNELIGPPLGGALFGLRQYFPFLVDSASYLLAGALVHRLPVESPRDSDAPATSIRTDVAEGLRYVWSHKLLRAMTVSVTLVTLMSFAAWAILVLFAFEVLHTDEVGFGLILGAGGAGGLLGVFVAPRAVARFGRPGVIVGGFILTGVTMLLLGLTSHPILAAAADFSVLFVWAIWNVAARALRASVPPARLLGRVVSSGRLLVHGAIPVGAVLGGWLAETFGLRSPFLIGGIAIILVGLGTIPWVNKKTVGAAVRTQQ